MHMWLRFALRDVCVCVPSQSWKGSVHFVLRYRLGMAATVEDEDAPVTVPWPEAEKLARAWEASVVIREQVRCEQKLLAWPSKETIGAVSSPALKLNRFVIAEVIRSWAVVCHEPKTPPIGWLRDEAIVFGRMSFRHVSKLPGEIYPL